MPYALTTRVAFTFCTLLLMPATSKSNCLVFLLYWTFIFVTFTDGLLRHCEKPVVSRTSPPSTPAGRALSKTRGRSRSLFEKTMVA